MLEPIFKVLSNVLKNKKFTNFFAFFTLLFISFIVTNEKSNFVQTLVYLTTYQIIRLILVLCISLLICFNLQLGLLFLISLSILINIPLTKNTNINIEKFVNIPNMVDKNKILKYNKNFKEPKKLTDNDKKQSNVNELDKEIEIEKNKENETKKRPKKKGYDISEDLYLDKMENTKKKNEKNDIEEVNLNEEEEDTIEKELNRKFTNDYKKMEEYDRSSSNSSNSQSSDSSTDSSDSEKEIDEIPMKKAREHMLDKLRNGLKKKYLNE